MIENRWRRREDGVLVNELRIILDDDDSQPPTTEELRHLIAEFSRSTQLAFERYVRGRAEQEGIDPERLLVKASAIKETIALRGWYIDPELTMRQLMKILVSFEAGREVEADRMLSDYFDASADSLCRDICALFPKRTAVITDAFWAHENGKYTLAVPVFLAQSDGMVFEVFDRQLFSMREGRPAVAPRIDQLPHLTARMLAALTIASPLFASARDRVSPEQPLNRHTVLHGESVEYGTHFNSCKAMSLLNYVATSLGRYRDECQAG